MLIVDRATSRTPVDVVLPFAALTVVWLTATGANCSRPTETATNGGVSESVAPDTDRPTRPGSETEPSADEEADLDPLAKHEWKHRPVVVFAPNREHPTYERQAAVLEARADGLRERDIVVYRIFEEGGSVGPDGAVSEAVADSLRERIEPDAPFVVVLVGKDGTEKLRRREMLEAETLFETIDAMPMRRREMRRRD